MHIDLMTGGGTWQHAGELARTAESAGLSGMVFTEAGNVPWMVMTAAALAAPSLQLSTGIAVAFPRSPMVSAAIAWDMARNTGGRFRLGLGSQVQAHIERRYSSEFTPPGPRLRDYVLAVRACFDAFAGKAKLDHRGPYYQLTLLPPTWGPPPLPDGVAAPKVDISAVNPWMLRMAGEVADGIHVHPFHSVPYLNEMLLPAVAEGTAKAGRAMADVSLLIPVFTIVGDTHEEQELTRAYVRQQVAFYGSTKPYAHQFDRLGYEGTSARINERLKAGDMAGMAALITDEMLEHYAVTATWDELAGKLIDRYQGIAERVIMYCFETTLRANPDNVGKWREIARAVRAAP